MHAKGKRLFAAKERNLRTVSEWKAEVEGATLSAIRGRGREMKTVAEILKETGLTDEQISALDPKVTAGLTTVVSTAAQAQEAAENAKRLQAQQYDQEIAPALDAWGNEKAQKDAEIAFYKAQLEGAKAGGFVPAALPNAPAPVAPARTPDGKFVANANPVPGSPEYVANFRKEAGAAIGSMLDLTWKYQSLYGTPMPDSPTALIAEANAQRMDPVSYAAKKYDFAGKEAAKKAAEQKAHDDAIVKATEDKKDKEWAEKFGNNPMIRQAEVSKF